MSEISELIRRRIDPNLNGSLEREFIKPQNKFEIEVIGGIKGLNFNSKLNLAIEILDLCAIDAEGYTVTADREDRDHWDNINSEVLDVIQDLERIKRK